MWWGTQQTKKERTTEPEFHVSMEITGFFTDLKRIIGLTEHPEYGFLEHSRTPLQALDSPKVELLRLPDGPSHPGDYIGGLLFEC